MCLRTRLRFGLFAAIIFCVGILGLGLVMTGYSQIRQTVSEIGEVGSPARIPFAVLMVMVAACLLIFASGLKDASRHAGYSALAAYLVGFMGLSAMGVGIFAYPSPLHNVFGISELIGYQAPLAFAVSWRRYTRSLITTFSWVMYGVILFAVAANLSVLDTHGALWAYERPVYGVVQRLLFAVWFIWCAGVSALLLRWTDRGGETS